MRRCDFFSREGRYNKDAKVMNIRNLDLQLFKGRTTFGMLIKGRVEAELQELIGTEKNRNKGDVDIAVIFDSLSNDKELIDTYERLTTLNGKRMFPLAVVGSHKKEVDRL
ncbi:hypothetical protein Tco_1139118, partial [Tanacetum coccineum]